MKRFLVFTVLMLMACSSYISKEELQGINGYWEIENVTFANGAEKEYPKANTTIDYMEWDGKKGFRKKVYPKLDGTFTTSDDAEAFTIALDGEQTVIHYANALSQWQEILIDLDADSFSVRNEAGMVYTYRRHEPIKLSL